LKKEDQEGIFRSNFFDYLLDIEIRLPYIQPSQEKFNDRAFGGNKWILLLNGAGRRLTLSVVAKFAGLFVQYGINSMTKIAPYLFPIDDAFLINPMKVNGFLVSTRLGITIAHSP